MRRQSAQFGSRFLFSIITCLLLVPLVTGCNWLKSNTTPRPLAKTATLAVYLASPISTPNSLAAVNPETGAVIYLTNPPIVTTSDVATIQRSGRSSELPELAVNLSPAGAQKLAAATTPAQGKTLAVVVNGEVICVAKIRSPLSNSFSISGGVVMKDREAILESLTGN